MPQTIVITGTSSGIGKAIAQLFLNKDWNVVATARKIETIQLEHPNLTKLELDVTNTTQIVQVVTSVLDRFKTIDVWVNNAGYGLVGIVEELSKKEIQTQFDTNVFGVIECIQQVLPAMRRAKKGVIINITSMGGRITFPLYSAYHASKWALEGWSESMQYELESIGVKVKIVEPGAIRTDFYGRSMRVDATTIREYQKFQKSVIPWMTKTPALSSQPEVVANTVWKAVNDTSNRLRYVAGLDSKIYLLIRKWVSDGVWKSLIRRIMKI